MDKIINLKYAKRGSGATTMDGAVRAKIVGNIETKVYDLRKRKFIWKF